MYVHWLLKRLSMNNPRNCAVLPALVDDSRSIVYRGSQLLLSLALGEKSAYCKHLTWFRKTSLLPLGGKWSPQNSKNA